MNEQDWLAQQFEANRRRLRAVAYRMLGSVSEAEDAVQEAWLRLSRSEPGETSVGGRLIMLCRSSPTIERWLP